ncbi:MAG: thiamine pyrophosphate-binding protein, partial [Anaerolineaceae bacterium]|nr:thiamine pyrophosphate-binding protein [Anaerolineaceae bacterium]
MKLSGSEIFWETLVKEGVETVFGYPGGGIMPIYHVMLDYPIHHVLSRHEQGAVHMADGFARAGGKVGVALATSGPGATNMVTGIATAMLDSSPIVCITGQVVGKLLGYDAFQEVDTSGITLPITKHNYMVTDIQELGQVLREAFYIARTGRPGPVLVDIPKDVQIAEIDWEYSDAPVYLPGYKFRPPKLKNQLDVALEMIQNARKPIILAGQGVLLSNAFQELRQFAEKAQIPVTTTLLGIGSFPASHPLNLGNIQMPRFICPDTNSAPLNLKINLMLHWK